MADSYICEISPPSQRGPLATAPQLLNTLGLVAGFFTCYGTTNINSSLAWRVPFIILSSLAMLFSFASLFWLVPSPRWLTLSGRHSEAPAIWDILGVSHAEREKIENQQDNGAMILETRGQAEIISQLDSNAPVQVEGGKKKQSFFDVFSADVRTRTGLAAFMMAMQQLSGIDGVLYVRRSVDYNPYIKSLTPLSMHLFYSSKLALPPLKLPSLPLEFLPLLYFAQLFQLSSGRISGADDTAQSMVASASAPSCS